MREILKSIYSKDPLDVDEEFLNDICQRIKDYYKNSDVGRHSYAEVSSYIYKMDQGYYEYLIYNLQNIYERFKKNGDTESQKAVFKLIDHIKLESGREVEIKEEYLNKISQKISHTVQQVLSTSMNSIDVKEDELKALIKNQKNEMKEEFDRQTKEIESQKNQMKEEFDRQTKEIDKINGNLISVLGIFGAIIVAFFGGLNLLGSVLENIHNASAYRLAFMALVVITGLFNVIFLLLHSISKLTKKSLWSNCKKCTSCSISSNKIECLYMKYPLVIVYNIISIWGLITLFVMYIIDKYNVIESLWEINNLTPSTGYDIVKYGIGLMALFEVVLIGSTWSIWRLLKLTNKCTCESASIDSESTGSATNSDIVAE